MDSLMFAAEIRTGLFAQWR